MSKLLNVAGPQFPSKVKWVIIIRTALSYVMFMKYIVQYLVRKFSPFYLGVNVTLYGFQKSPHISEQKGDPGGLDYYLLGEIWLVVVVLVVMTAGERRPQLP